MPSRRRHRSIGPGSGPASTTTALRPPADSTSPSPCPTFARHQAHPDAASRAGGIASEPTRRDADRDRQQHARDHGWRAAMTATAIPTATITAPPSPLRTARFPPGTAAARSATSSNHQSGGPATRTSRAAAAATPQASTAVAAPTTVIGATAGATSTFATIETMLTVPDIAATSGAVTTNAASATAHISASQRGRPVPAAASPEPATRRPDLRSRTPTARIRNRLRVKATAPAGRRRRGERRNRLLASTGHQRQQRDAAIAAARSTLGDGRAMTTKATSAIPASSAPVRGPRPTPRTTRSTAPRTMDTFAPTPLSDG